MSKNTTVLQNDSTVFSVVSTQFSDEQIETKEFLQASADAVSIIGKFGKMFAPVTNDMTNNIQKLTRKYEEDCDANKYLEDMILKEQTQGEGIATDALLWLRRALHFLSIFYQTVIDDSYTEHPSNDMAPFLKKAYSATLEPYHGWLGTQLFNVLSRFAPSRRHLMFTLAMDRHNHEETVIRDMQIYNQRLYACVQRLIEFYINCGLESPATV